MDKEQAKRIWIDFIREWIFCDGDRNKEQDVLEAYRIKYEGNHNWQDSLTIKEMDKLQKEEREKMEGFKTLEEYLKTLRYSERLRAKLRI